MMQQWFLDLDGVRSGPYQTPEVLSLIAEGEVLPHHRIAQGLKDQNWITILDWRLDQAHQKVPEVKEALHWQEQTPPHAFSPDYLEIPMEEKTADAPAPVKTPERKHDLPPASGVMPPPLLAAPNASFPYAQSSAPPAQQPIMHPPKRDLPVAEQASKDENLFIPAVSEPETDFTSVPVDAPKKEKTARDPMAEMFDMLQNTKQKREAKSQQQAQQQAKSGSNPHASTSTAEARSATPTNSSGNKNLTKTLAIGVAITIVGFALGQIFQSAGPPVPTPVIKVEDPKPSATPVAAAPTNAPSSPVIDRSTDKMTIRNKVDHAGAAPMIKVTTNGQTKTLDHKPTEKELDELKDLKKELQELKALKEELKSNPNGNDDNGNDVSADDGEAPLNPTGTAQAYPQNNLNQTIPASGVPNNAPNGQYPSPGTSDVHY